MHSTEVGMSDPENFAKRSLIDKVARLECRLERQSRELDRVRRELVRKDEYFQDFVESVTHRFWITDAAGTIEYLDDKWLYDFIVCPYRHV